MGTSITILLYANTLLIVLTATYRYRIHEHMAKMASKGNALERALRVRDDKIRFVDQVYLTRQFGNPATKQFFS
jgi:hypothetical protein